MPVTSWSTVNGNNNSAPPDGAPEGQAPSTLNNCIRQVMADVARESQINNVKVLKTVAGTNTITADMDPELASYSAGMMVVMTPANNNTGATTLAIDGLAALDVQKGDHVALVSGDLVAGVPALLILDSGGDDWILLNPQSSPIVSGSFTAELTGMAATTTGTVNYRISGHLCTIYNPGSPITGTSNLTSMTMIGLPAECQTTISIRANECLVFNSGGGVYANATVNGATVTFNLLQESGGDIVGQLNWFDNSGTKGIPGAFAITYPLV